MYRRGNDGQVLGVGTMPFMALVLLEDEALCGQVRHLYEHDAESFVWVLLWLCVRYENGKLRNDPPLNAWLGISARQCWAEKSSFLFRREWRKVVSGNGRNALVVARCLSALRKWYDIESPQPTIMGEDDGSRANTAFIELLQEPYSQHS